MSEQTPESASGASSLPDAPNLEWLRKAAKHRLAQLRQTNHDAKLADAQFAVAMKYGFSSWRALKAHVDSLTVDGQLFDATHRAIADFLVSRGARHHIYSAISVGDEQLIRELVAEQPSELRRPQSHNENSRLPLHFAVQKGFRRMVELLLELGADPAATDASGFTPSAYATAPDIDRPLIEAIRNRTGHTLFTSVALNDWKAATRLATVDPGAVDDGGVLHLMAKRNNVPAVNWLLEHGANPNTRWDHWDSSVTPLHLAILGGHIEAVRLLLEAGADTTIRDSKHDGDALNWAEFMRRAEIAEMIKARK